MVPPTSGVAPPSHGWFITDTGGTGGGFGRGDPRNTLCDVSFINAHTGVAVGFSGAFRTDDGGLTWRKLPIGTITNAQGTAQADGWYCVRMVSTNEIWALGHYHPGGCQQTRLTRSLDGGNTWTNLLAGQVCWAGRLYFPTPRDRWVIAGSNPSFHSTDGGSTWRPVNWGESVCVQDVNFAPDPTGLKIGYAVGAVGYAGEGRVLKTEDGGLTWRRLVTPAQTPELSRVCFLTPFEGWLGGTGGRILYTADGGQTWEDRSVDAVNDQRMCALLMLPTGRGFAALQAVFSGGRMNHDWTLFATEDGGRTWRPELGGWKSINALCSLGPDLIWGVGGVPGYIPNDLVIIWKGR